MNDCIRDRSPTCFSILDGQWNPMPGGQSRNIEMSQDCAHREPCHTDVGFIAQCIRAAKCTQIPHPALAAHQHKEEASQQQAGHQQGHTCAKYFRRWRPPRFLRMSSTAT
jgi:hypothetical protein